MLSLSSLVDNPKCEVGTVVLPRGCTTEIPVIATVKYGTPRYDKIPGNAVYIHDDFYSGISVRSPTLVRRFVFCIDLRDIFVTVSSSGDGELLVWVGDSLSKASIVQELDWDNQPEMFLPQMFVLPPFVSTSMFDVLSDRAIPLHRMSTYSGQKVREYADKQYYLRTLKWYEVLYKGVLAKMVLKKQVRVGHKIWLKKRSWKGLQGPFELNIPSMPSCSGRSERMYFLDEDGAQVCVQYSELAHLKTAEENGIEIGMPSDYPSIRTII